MVEHGTVLWICSFVLYLHLLNSSSKMDYTQFYSEFNLLSRTMFIILFVYYTSGSWGWQQCTVNTNTHYV